MRDKDPLAVVEMFVTLILVLKDSAEVSSELLDSFKQSKGYYFLSDILVDFYKRDDPAAKEASRNLVLLVASLVVTGHKVLRPSMSIESPFQSPDYVIPSPTTAGPGEVLRKTWGRLLS